MMQKHEHIIIIAIIIFFSLLGFGAGFVVFGPLRTSHSVAATETGYLQHDMSIAGLEFPPRMEEVVPEPEQESPVPPAAHLYVVTTQNGYITVHLANVDGRAGEQVRTLSTSVASLPAEEQERLAHGINVYTEDALIRILEDYGS